MAVDWTHLVTINHQLNTEEPTVEAIMRIINELRDGLGECMKEMDYYDNLSESDDENGHYRKKCNDSYEKSESLKKALRIYEEALLSLSK